jgi:hypothetical protein
MKHLTEEQIELYILHAPEVATERRRIAAHLKICAGCRTQSEEVGRYYRDSEVELVSRRAHGTGSRSVGLVVQRAYLEAEPQSRAVTSNHETAAYLDRFGGFIRQHPFIIGTAGVGFMTFAVLLLFLFSIPKAKNRIPDSYHYDVSHNLLVIDNRALEPLWELPSSNIARSSEEESRSHNYRVQLADLENNGSKEVLTTLPLPGDERQSGGILRVFGPDKGLRLVKSLNRSFRYLDRQYDTSFTLSTILIRNYVESEPKEILVSANNYRSPHFLARLTHTGEEIGTYWHFGQIPSVYQEVLQANGKPMVILCGANDCADSLHMEFPVIIVLDPTKIVGATESSVTPGFGLNKSRAELYYIQLPVSDIDRADAAYARVAFLTHEGPDRLVFSYVGKGSVGFDFVFSRDMQILEVKSLTGIEEVHSQLRREGRIQSNFGPGYLRDLAAGVRYWDGKGWRSQITQVSAP